MKSALTTNSASERFGLIPTPKRIDADPRYCGKSITIAFLDSGFYAHPDLVEPENRILKYLDITHPQAGEQQLHKPSIAGWHGMQTSVVAAGNGHLSQGHYRGIASQANLVLIKVGSQRGIEQRNIAKGLRWVLRHKDTYNIRIVNVSLGGNKDIPYQESEVSLAAEALVEAGIVVIVAAGNSGFSKRPKLTPPGNSPSVITVGGYDDNNHPSGSGPKMLCDDLPQMYGSDFGYTADGVLKPELIAPAIWIPAPLMPQTPTFQRARALWQLIQENRTQLNYRVRELWEIAGLPEKLAEKIPPRILAAVEKKMQGDKLIHEYYQHVDGTSFAAPIVTSVVAQMLEVNPQLTPAMVKNILTSTAARVPYFPQIRQGFGILDARQAVIESSQAQATQTYQVLPSPLMVNGKLWFRYFSNQARSVTVSGSFNDWHLTSLPLQLVEPGVWSLEITAPLPGRYAYKYIIDNEKWINDPGNVMREPDGFTGFNSIVKIVD
jgi:serine protease AprX